MCRWKSWTNASEGFDLASRIEKSRLLHTVRESVFLAILGFLGAAVFFMLYPKLQPAAKLHLQINRAEARHIAKEYARSLDFDLSGYVDFINFYFDDQVNSFLQENRVAPEQAEPLLHYRPRAGWRVIFRNPARNERFEFLISARGEIFRFWHVLPDEVPGESQTRAEALAQIRAFLSERQHTDWQKFELVDARVKRHEARTDYVILWAQQQPGVGGVKLQISAEMVGGHVGGWARSLGFPHAFLTTFSERVATGTMLELLQQILPILIFILALGVFVLRFHAGEVSLKNAALYTFGFFIIALVASFNFMPGQDWAKLAVLENNRNTFIFITYVILLFMLFVGSLSILVLWASGDSLTRELWGKKLVSFDALFVKHFFFQGLGAGLIRGFAIGFFLLGLWYASLATVVNSPQVWPGISAEERLVLSAYFPLGAPVVLGVYTSFMGIASGALFLFAFFKKVLRNVVLAVILTSLLVNAVHTHTTAMVTPWLQMSLALLTGIVLYSFYLRYDLFTLFTSVVVAVSVPLALMLVLQEDELFRLAGWSSFVILGSAFVYGLAALLRGESINDAEVEPGYVQHLTERERLRMELEIARRAQLRMLPQRIPEMPGIDIAALSEPANEVGGDFYDFVTYGDRQLGIVVGDVSGKGMPAAIYMTLVKGLLQGIANAQIQPAQVLQQINKRFYRTAERNIFVTLFYCIIQPAAGQATFARAGHNPAIIRHAGAHALEWLQPAGLAIGLDRQPTFDRLIEQQTVPVHAGDVIVLYSDGLTEARNSKDEEFGEARLEQCIASVNGDSAEAILENIVVAVKKFAGRAPQADDLTVVVIKIKE